MKNYVAIVEPSDDGKTWWISFPGLPGITSAADCSENIVSQARDALASAIEGGVRPPPAIEDGVIPPANLSDYHHPLVVLVPYEAPVAVAAEGRLPVRENPLRDKRSPAADLHLPLHRLPAPDEQRFFDGDRRRRRGVPAHRHYAASD